MRNTGTFEISDKDNYVSAAIQPVLTAPGGMAFFKLGSRIRGSAALYLLSLFAYELH